jgi:hypothetical protein
LAAAYAETGDFDAAVRWQAKLLKILPKNDALSEGNWAVLERYQRRQPYRDPTLGP